jgi:hypothetical protein
MEISRFEPLKDALKSKYNLFLFLLGTVLLVDLFIKSPLTSQVVLLQMKIMKVDPASHFTMHTFFGTYYSVAALARVFDLAGMGLGFVLSGWGYGMGLFTSLTNKPVE